MQARDPAWEITALYQAHARKASGEWQLIAAAHNLMLAVTSGHLTPQALVGLAR